MLQKVSFAARGVELIGVLHLPDGEARAAALVLHGYGGHPEQPHIVETCEALASAGVGAYRFPYRDHQPPKMTLPSAVEDAENAVRVLKAHPRLDAGKLAVVGFSFGGAVAAVLAGRQRAVRALVLAAATSEWEGKAQPIEAVKRTKAAALLLWGTHDTLVSTMHAERYLLALRSAGVKHRFETIAGADHDFGPASKRAEMTRRVAEWVRESIAAV